MRPPAKLIVLVAISCVINSVLASPSRHDRIWPVGGTTMVDLAQSSPFGPRLRASSSFRYDYHRGVDIPIPEGTPLFAIDNGVVRISGDDSAYSDRVVQIRHTDWDEEPLDVTGNSNFYSNYIHMFNETVVEGEEVSKGDLIGYSYKSLDSGFEHLHFEIRAGGIYQRHACNPWKYLPNIDNSYSTFEANVTLTPNYNSLPCEAVVNISMPPDQLTFNRIELLANGGDVIRVFDMCEDNLEHSFDDLELPLLEGNIYISPMQFSSQSYANGEPLRYGFEFLDLPTPGGTVVAKAYDVFGNSVETLQATYVCPAAVESPQYRYPATIIPQSVSGGSCSPEVSEPYRQEIDDDIRMILSGNLTLADK